MPKFSRAVSSASSPALLATAMAALTVCSAAGAATLEVFPYPNADSFYGVSNNATAAVAYNYDGIYFLDAARNATMISAHTALSGYAGTPTMSANGGYIAGSMSANGYAQAGLYNVGTHSWTALGGLSNGAYYVGTAAMPQLSQTYGISADGSTVLGAAAYSTTAGAQASNLHPTVWRNGQAYDLNAGGSGNGRIVTSNADGTVVAGYTNINSQASYRVWAWNGSGYTQAASPMATNPYDGTTVPVKVTALSSNGVWGAGDSSIFMASQNYGSFGNAIVFQPATLWNSQTNATIAIPFDHVIDYTNPTSMYHDVAKNMKASIAGVLDDGTVFGTFDSCSDTLCGAGRTSLDSWVYSLSTGQSITFDSYLAAHGITLSATQHVSHIDGVSADGSAVTGLIFDTATASTSSFIVSNISAVPEPGQWLLMALGLPLLMARRLRQRRAA